MIPASTSEYLVLKKVRERQVVREPRPGFPLRVAIIDVETTGKEDEDELIQFGAIQVTCDRNGHIGDVTEIYTGLRQPTKPIPPFITAMTGITDHMVAGQHIDLDMVRSLIQPVDLIIAHNARFDHYHCSLLDGIFDAKPWACSLTQINWSERGCESAKLGNLIISIGMFHDGHQALPDCFALLELLRHGARSDWTCSPFAELYRRALERTVRVYAVRSPFQKNSQIRARGYYWNDGRDGQPRSYWRDVPEHEVDLEMQYLRDHIYEGRGKPVIGPRMTAVERYRRN